MITGPLRACSHSMCPFAGHIEFLDRANIADNSVDLVISNCVVNLSPDKPRVIQEAFRVLRPGGELHFSDGDTHSAPQTMQDVQFQLQ